MAEFIQDTFEYNSAFTLLKRWRDIISSTLYKLEAQFAPDRKTVSQARQYLRSLELEAVQLDDLDRVASARLRYARLLRRYSQLGAASEPLSVDAPLQLAQFDIAQEILRTQLALRDWWLRHEMEQPVLDRTKLATWYNERQQLESIRKMLRYDDSRSICWIIETHRETSCLDEISSEHSRLLMHSDDIEIEIRP